LELVSAVYARSRGEKGLSGGTDPQGSTRFVNFVGLLSFSFCAGFGRMRTEEDVNYSLKRARRRNRCRNTTTSRTVAASVLFNVNDCSQYSCSRTHDNRTHDVRNGNIGAQIGTVQRRLWHPLKAPILQQQTQCRANTTTKADIRMTYANPKYTTTVQHKVNRLINYT
jgi:hypothetical protein